jgi:hypothetical protein
MIFLSSLFSILLRLSMLGQGQGEVVELDWTSLLQISSPASTSTGDEQWEPVLGALNGTATLASNIEVEEKVEVESEGTPEAWLLNSSKLVKKSPLNSGVSIFGNKAIRGSILLYDFFHSWKIHLS